MGRRHWHERRWIPDRHGRRALRLPLLTLDWWRITNAAAVAFLVLFVIVRAVVAHHGDAWAYYSANLDDLYSGSAVGVVSYVYPPPLAQIVQPLRILPYQVFFGIVLAGEVAALAWFVTPVGAVSLVLAGQPNLADELINGNINLLLGACLVAGLRWPAAWAVHGLTKVTGILPGLVWFAVRREWRALAVAACATAAIVVISVALSPNAWLDWLVYVGRDYGQPHDHPAYAFLTPLTLRLPLAIAIAAVAAWRGMRWILPIAVIIAIPTPAIIHWVMALATVRLYRDERQVPRPSPSPSPNAARLAG